MRRQYILVEDVIREELMIEYYIKKELQRLDEGKANIIDNFKKMWTTVKGINGGTKTMKSIIDLVGKLRLDLLPSLITKGIKWLPNNKTTSRVVSFYDNNKIKVKTSELFAKFTIGNLQTVYGLRSGDKTILQTFCDLCMSIYDLAKGLIGLIPCGGNIAVLVLEFLEAVIENWFKSFSNEWDRAWAIAKSFFKKQIPFTFNDLKKTWESVKTAVKNSITYGGPRGIAAKEALGYFSKARYALRNTKSSQFDLKVYRIAVAYRWVRNRRFPTQDEIKKEKKFCTDIVNQRNPSLIEAAKIWPGINPSKDDGTCAQHILAEFGWNVLSDDNKVNDWFKQACDIAAMSFSELDRHYGHLWNSNGELNFKQRQRDVPVPNDATYVAPRPQIDPRFR